MLHGPAELFPISSSGHTTAIPWLLGSDYAELGGEERKALEVALHAGAALGLLIGRRHEWLTELRELGSRHLLVLAVASAPAGLAGLGLERRIESRLSAPRTIAAGLLAGGVAMALADRAPEERAARDAGLDDGLVLGLAQAFALLPGVSRRGATLTAARWRRFRRRDAACLSGELAWPVIGGATLLKGWRLHRSGLGAGRTQLLTGAATSLLSTLALSRLRHSGRQALLPFAVYRAGLAAVILLHLRHREGDPEPPQ